MSFISALDHVVVLVNDLEAAVGAYQALFGRAPAWRSSSDGTDAVLFTLDNMTLELMSPNGEGGAADRVRAALSEQGEGLASLCFRTNDIMRMHRRLDRMALQPEPVSDGESRDLASGALLTWRRSRASTEATRGVRLFFLEMAAERPRSAVTADAPVVALDHIVIATGDPERSAALYGARLGLEMVLDRSHPDWGHLMFFRCGDLIVETVQRPGAALDAAHDRLYGMSWRVADADATRARLISAGIDASDVRSGRQPGTRVLTLRSGTCGIPTLLVERTPRPSRP
ncbi:MAG TPA: VOC family protein [Bradyrhizobium sp.]|nr:VOC family protein [Bradyrhizobium sp.]